MQYHKTTIAVLGTGAWGTALAILLAKNGYTIKLWSKFSDEVISLAENRCNVRYLPNITLPNNIAVVSDLAEALQNTQDILIAVPSHAFRSTVAMIKNFLPNKPRLFWATKGLDTSDKMLHEVVCEIIGAIPMAVISGPTFANEVAQGLPTAITVASNDITFGQDVAKYLHNDTFRAYTNNDLIGVQIAGAVKNVLAIAVGIADGMSLGSNARAALITRSLAELTRLGKILGGKTETFMGLAGIGDLVLTCTDNQSRNRRFGLALGQGVQRQEAEKTINQTIEGIPNSKTTYLLALNKKVEMPIVEQVYRILYEDLTPQTAVTTLLSRTPKAEF
jgi:glycerol-3-phosphate dehydrogenase (NAD(P)+)